MIWRFLLHLLIFYSVHAIQELSELNDVIGGRAHEQSNLRLPSSGGCAWFGNSPFCFESCPSTYDFIRESSGKCSEEDTYCPPDASFGEMCLKIFTFQTTKKFCCRSDPSDCSWSGRWMGSQDAFNFYCRFDASVGPCGQLNCSVNAPTFQGYNSSVIEGDNCDEISMWNLRGKASCGYIAWYQEDQLMNSWYKSH